MAIGRVITVLGAAGLAWAWGNREQLKEKWGRTQGGSNPSMGQPGQAGEGSATSGGASGMERSAGMGGSGSGTSPTGEYGSAAGPMGSRGSSTGAGGTTGSSPSTGTSTTSVDDDSMALGTGPSPAGI